MSRHQHPVCTRRLQQRPVRLVAGTLQLVSSRLHVSSKEQVDGRLRLTSVGRLSFRSVQRNAFVRLRGSRDDSWEWLDRGQLGGSEGNRVQVILGVDVQKLTSTPPDLDAVVHSQTR